MRNVMCSTLATLTLIGAAPAFAADQRPPALNCEVGPLKRSFGGSPWLVYACSDNRSAVVVSDQGNPATPFYFILYVKPDGEMKFYGEGTGAKSATQPAFDELRQLDQRGVAELVAEARSATATP